MTEPFGPELTSIRAPRVKAARHLSKRALRLRVRGTPGWQKMRPGWAPLSSP